MGEISNSDAGTVCCLKNDQINMFLLVNHRTRTADITHIKKSGTASKLFPTFLLYEVSIMTGEATLRREQGLRGSIDILKYKAQKLAEEYATLKEKVQGSGLKLSAEMAQYIVRTGQKEQFAEYQRSIDRQQGEERS